MNKAEFDEKDTHTALIVLGMHGREYGEITRATIARIADLVGLSRGVNYSGRQAAKRALRTMLSTDTAKEAAQEASADIPIPTAVHAFVGNVAAHGVIEASDILIRDLNLPHVSKG